MQNKRNDEWGVIIQKQLEIDDARNALEKARHKHQQEEYKKQLDALLTIKNQQKRQIHDQKSQDIKEITTQLFNQTKEEDLKKQQKFEYHKKIVEENLKLQALNNKNKHKERSSMLALDIHNNELDKMKHLESQNKMSQHRRSVEVGMNLNLKLVQDKHNLKQKEGMEEKQKEIYLSKMEELRYQQRDEEYRAHLTKIQEVQNKKLEVFSKHIAPQLVVKELNYNQWVNNAEEVKRKEEETRLRELDRKKGENSKAVKEALKWQSENKYLRKNWDRECDKAMDEELNKRIEVSVRIDEDRNVRRKQEALNYREELLQQAAADKARKKNEFQLSEREKKLNRSILGQDKSSILRGANEILKSVDLAHKRSSNVSPSLKNTTLQLSSLELL